VVIFLDASEFDDGQRVNQYVDLYSASSAKFSRAPAAGKHVQKVTSLGQFELHSTNVIAFYGPKGLKGNWKLSF